MHGGTLKQLHHPKVPSYYERPPHGSCIMESPFSYPSPSVIWHYQSPCVWGRIMYSCGGVGGRFSALGEGLMALLPLLL